MAYNRDTFINIVKTAMAKTEGTGSPTAAKQKGAEGVADFVEWLIDNVELQVTFPAGSSATTVCIDGAPLNVTAAFNLNGNLKR
jgi:hypothetical protein